MSGDPILAKIDSYYSGKLRDHGPTPRGVDWNSEASQQTRFEQLLKLLPPAGQSYSVLDYGCGYGAFLDFLRERGQSPQYTGFDVAEAMVDSARTLHPDAAFLADPSALVPADFVVASGIFSVKMDVDTTEWEAYVEGTIATMDRLSRKGFALNLLTAYSDPERMRPDLYYASPERYFARCTAFSRWVALLHDYGLYEFTLLVRKD